MLLLPGPRGQYSRYHLIFLPLLLQSESHGFHSKFNRFASVCLPQHCRFRTEPWFLLASSPTISPVNHYHHLRWAYSRMCSCFQLCRGTSFLRLDYYTPQHSTLTSSVLSALPEGAGSSGDFILCICTGLATYLEDLLKLSQNPAAVQDERLRVTPAVVRNSRWKVGPLSLQLWVPLTRVWLSAGFYCFRVTSSVYFLCSF